MQISQEDDTARIIAERSGLAVIPPFAGLVVRNERGDAHGAVILSHFDGEDCEIQCVGHDYWTAGTVRKVFRYALDALNCKRVSARTVASNERCIAAMEAIGFRREGVKRKAHEGEDVVMFGMLREECRLLAGRA
jgi:RimJ/RimL family protein N-acetyltransferase